MLTDLISEIDAHLAWREAQGHKLAESTFGFKAVKDGKLVARLRAGRSISVTTMQSIQAFIGRDRAEVEAPSRADAA